MKTFKLGAVAALALALAACPGQDRDVARGDPARDAATTERRVDTARDAESVHLDEFAGSGVQGEVHITPHDSRTDIMVLVQDARPNSSVVVSLHTGTCDAPGPRVEELGTMSINAQGQGQIQASVEMVADQVMNGLHLVAIHEEGREAASPIACARVPDQRNGVAMPRGAGATGS
jgi:hypothetical protein